MLAPKFCTFGIKKGCSLFRITAFLFGLFVCQCVTEHFLEMGELVSSSVAVNFIPIAKSGQFFNRPLRIKLLQNKEDWT